MIRIPGRLLEEIRTHGAEAYPEECCGALLGAAEGGSKVVRATRRLENRNAGPRERRFYVGPEEFRQAEAGARNDGLDIVGIYHSHPDHPAHPSEYDREQAWPWYSYLILSVERGQPRDLTSWVLVEDRGRFEQEELEWA